MNSFPLVCARGVIPVYDARWLALIHIPYLWDEPNPW